MMLELSLASARLSKLWILCLSDLLDGDYVKNFFYSHIFFFKVSNRILSDALILPVSQLLGTQQVMTSPIRLHIEYLTQTYYILMLVLWSKLMKNLAIMAGFNTI